MYQVPGWFHGGGTFLTTHPLTGAHVPGSPLFSSHFLRAKQGVSHVAVASMQPWLMQGDAEEGQRHRRTSVAASNRKSASDRGSLPRIICSGDGAQGLGEQTGEACGLQRAACDLLQERKIYWGGTRCDAVAGAAHAGRKHVAIGSCRMPVVRRSSLAPAGGDRRASAFPAAFWGRVVDVIGGRCPLERA